MEIFWRMRLLPLFFLLIALVYNPILCDDDELTEEAAEEIKPKMVYFTPPKVPEGAYLALFFESPYDLTEKLTVSEAKKDGADDAIAKYDGTWTVENPVKSAIVGDFALVLKSAAKHHAISTKLARAIKFDTPELVIQYEVNFQNGVDCGGAYVKLLSESVDFDLKHFNDKTPYTIMFGPDKCALDDKLHFIFRHEHPTTGEFEEKHATRPNLDLRHYFTDMKTHLYTLVLRSDNTFERYIDQVLAQSGSLLSDFEPAVNPPKEIDDPDDKKPEDWDEREKIVDEKATKPDDWDETLPQFIIDENAIKPEGWLDDEPETVADPNAEMPKDWDPSMDGEWEAPKINNPKCAEAPGCGEWKKPMIQNPDYKGKWSPPMIPNPSYRGIWSPKKIANPDYYEDLQPYKRMKPVTAVGFELWSMTDSIAFDNILIVDSKKAADEFARETWIIKRDAERMADPRAQSVVDAIKETYRERPWVIVVVALVCTLPILLCCVYFCRSSPSKAAMHKKTDEDVDEVEHTYDEISKSAAGDRSRSISPARKVDLESESDGVDESTTEPAAGGKNLRKRSSRKD